MWAIFLACGPVGGLLSSWRNICAQPPFPSYLLRRVAGMCLANPSAVFNRCAESLEQGRRLENLSWRLWNRATLQCESKPQFPDTPTADPPRSLAHSKTDVPDLSASLDTVATDESEHDPPQRAPSPAVHIAGLTSCQSSVDSLSSSRGRAKPISSQKLQSMVMDIKKTLKDEKPSLPASVHEAVPAICTPRLQRSSPTPTPESRQQQNAEPTSPRRQSEQRSSQSSTSTVPLSSPEGMERSRTSDSQTSAELIVPNSVVRGFVPKAISSHRIATQSTAQPQSPKQPVSAAVPIKSAMRSAQAEQPKNGFMLGVSSGDESSIDDKALQPRQSSLTAALKGRLGGVKKTTSFKEVVEVAPASARDDEAAIESDDEEEEDEDSEEEEPDEEGDVSESAIEDDDEDSDWEDSVTDSGAASPPDRPLFQRVDSKANLVSRRSLLTTQLHESERAQALAGLAQRSQPALRRTKGSMLSGPSVVSPTSNDEEDNEEDESALEMSGTNPAAASRARPIVRPPPNARDRPLSPRTTRRHMLASELTESLRKHLLWERQQKTTTVNALKRRHTAHDVTNLKGFPGEAEKKGHGYKKAAAADGDTSKTNSWNAYVDHGEYHSRGW